MEVRLDELRLRYERLSDEALIDAWTQGPEAYMPQAWAVIAAEVAARGLVTPGLNDSPTPTPDGTPTDELASGAIRHLLNSGSSLSALRERLARGGMSEPEVERLLRPRVDESRKRLEARATRQMRIGVLVGTCGVLVTVFSYFSAESTGGHYYVVAWGAVLFGVVQFVRGLTLDQHVRRGHNVQSSGLSE